MKKTRYHGAPFDTGKVRFSTVQVRTRFQELRQLPRILVLDSNYEKRCRPFQLCAGSLNIHTDALDD